MDNILNNIYYESLSGHKIYGMGNTTVEDILDFTQYQIENIIYELGLDNKFEIIELSVCGSRINENPHKDADLDIVLYYRGNIESENLYNIFHKEEFRNQLIYDGVYIDIKPELNK